MQGSKEVHMDTAPSVAIPNPWAELRRLRERADLSTRALAKRIGKSQGYVSLIENGKRPNAGYEVIRRFREACEAEIQRRAA
jgi:transcriptional regulator with XRE-family HTH domain